MTNAERSNPQEKKLVGRPTELDLFRLNSAELARTSKLLSMSDNLSRDLKISTAAFLKRSERYESGISSLKRIVDEKWTLAWQYTSLKTISAAYIKISDDLSARGVSTKDITDFFLRCLTANSRYHSMYTFSEGGQEVTNRRFLASERAGFPEMNTIRRKLAGTPPNWFHGSTRNWLDFFEPYSKFRELLEPEYSHQVTRLSEGHLGFTSLKWIPDWLENIEGEPPIRERVEKDFIDDSEEFDLAIRYIDKAHQQTDNLYNKHFRPKFLKALLKVEKDRRALFPNSPFLPHLLVYLYATDGMHEYAAENPDSLRHMTSEEIDAIHLCPDKSREKSIRIFSDKMPVGREIMALWIEQKFREAGLPASTVLNDEQVVGLGMFGPQNKEQLAKYRGTDKKFFRIYNYQLAPLFNLLRDNERAYLTELIRDSRGEYLETIIWEMAYIFSNRLAEENKPELNTTLPDIRKFSFSWISNNWQWAYRGLRHMLITQAEKSDKLENLKVDEVQDINVGREEGDEEFETLLKESREGNLGSWNVFYSVNRRVKNKGELVEIPGPTLELREEALNQVLGRLGRQVPIKNSSIINALDWIVTLSAEEIRKLNWESVNGEVFKKVRRDTVRIFFQIDPQKRRFAFFLYKKKDWEYKGL